MSRFPTEILLLITEEASISSLATLSFCSRHTRAAVFSLLHHTMHISSADRLLDFCARVSKEEGADGRGCVDGLRVAGHVKCLRLDGEYEKDAFNELIAVVPHLRRLEGFAVPMDGTCLPQTVLKSMRTHCPRFDSVSLFFRDDFDASDEDLEATFALEGLKHFAIISWEISPSENWRDNSLPPSIIKALRASPALETLHLAIGIENYREWDVHQTFAELSGAHFPRLRALAIREQADLNCWKLCDATDPFLQFLHAHHAQLETLALPSTCAYGPTSLRLPAHFFPSLTAFEGSGFLCRQLSELPHPAARLKRLAMLWDEDNDDDQAQLLGTLRAYSALEALWISPTDTMSLTHTPAQLHVLAQAAPNLTELRTGVNLSENDVNLDDLAPALAAFSHLQTLCVRVAILTRNTPTKPEEFVASLAAHCPHLHTVIDIGQSYVHWEAHVSRPEGIISVRRETRIPDIFDRYMWQGYGRI